jgi:hypothetical protein
MKNLILFSTILFVSCQKDSNVTPNLNDLNGIELTHSFDSTTYYWPDNKSTFIHHTGA